MKKKKLMYLLFLFLNDFMLDMQFILLSLFSTSVGISFSVMVGWDTGMAGSKGPNYLFSFCFMIFLF